MPKIQRIFATLQCSLLAVSLGLAFPLQAQESTIFPNNGQRLEIFDNLVEEIERVDAIGITTRNQYKKTSWSSFIQTLRFEFSNASNWDELRTAITSLDDGFTNVHSHISPGPLFPAVTTSASSANQSPTRRIGFTYPPVEFFAAEESKDAQASLNEEFRTFVDLECQAAHPINCAHRFARLAGPGQSPTPEQQRFEPCNSVAKRYTDAWALAFSGHSLCVLTRDAVALVKIKLFSNWGQKGIYCGPRAVKGTACHDIYNALKLISQSKPKHLIFDMQNNRGGSENTPYIAAFATSAFHDLRVQYRKIRELDDDRMRRELFYSSRAAENWFKNLHTANLYEAIAYGDFLPARADFCRGARDCSIAPIKRHALSNPKQKGLILTNGNCVSSCDDFVWRIKETNNWRVIGQLPVTDGAYARIEGGVFIDDEGRVSTQTWGDGAEPETNSERLLIRYRVPISRTVNQLGELLEGNSNVLDLQITHTKAQFTNNDAHLANAAFQTIERDP